MQRMNTTTSLNLAGASSGNGHGQVEHIECNQILPLSGARGEFGQLRIEAEELHRELAETRTRASLAEQRVADLTAMLDDMREQRDRWLAQADRLSSVLTDQQRKAPRWWPWRRSTRDVARLQITHVRDNSNRSEKRLEVSTQSTGPRCLASYAACREMTYRPLLYAPIAVSYSGHENI